MILKSKHYLPFALFLAAHQANGQTLTILNEENKPVKDAHISYFSIANPQVSGTTITDTNGVAHIPNKDQNVYGFSIYALGYKSITDTLYTDSTIFLNKEAVSLNDVVITAQYAPNSQEKSVYRVKVIDRKKIDAMGAQNLRDALTNELNIRLSQDNILGSSMTLQGITGQNIKILIDGVAVIGRQNGNIDLSQINLNNTDRIEIVEGPLSVNYGTDALGGTINIITKKNAKPGFTINENNYYESVGNYNADARVGYHKDKSTVSVSGGRYYFDGWKPGEKAFSFPKKELADTNRVMSWKPKQQYFGTFNYGYDLNKTLKLNYTSDYFYERITNLGAPSAPYYESAFDDYYNTYRFNNALSANGNLSKKFRLNSVLAYNYYKLRKNTYYNDLTTLHKTLTTSDGDQDTTVDRNFTFRSSITNINPDAFANYEIGYDIERETMTGARILNKTKSIADYAIFGSAEYHPVQNLTIRPGLRISHNTAYSAPLVPSLNFKYSLPDGQEGNGIYNFRLSYARGFRAPGLKELYFYFYDVNHNISGNPDLKAEYSHNFNASVSYNRSKDNHACKLEWNAFYNTIQNMITLAVITGVQYSYINIDKSKNLGTQLNAEYAFNHLKLSGGVSLIGYYNQLSEDASVNKFSWSPEARASVFYEWMPQNMTFGIFYKYTGQLPTFQLNSESNVVKTVTQSYNTAEASIARKFWDKRITLTIGAKNLFNVTNIVGYSAGDVHSAGSTSMPIAMGRTYFMQLNFNFNTFK